MALQKVNDSNDRGSASYCSKLSSEYHQEGLRKYFTLERHVDLLFEWHPRPRPDLSNNFKVHAGAQLAPGLA